MADQIMTRLSGRPSASSHSVWLWVYFACCLIWTHFGKYKEGRNAQGRNLHKRFHTDNFISFQQFSHFSSKVEEKSRPRNPALTLSDSLVLNSFFYKGLIQSPSWAFGHLLKNLIPSHVAPIPIDIEKRETDRGCTLYSTVLPWTLYGTYCSTSCSPCTRTRWRCW